MMSNDNKNIGSSVSSAYDGVSVKHIYMNPKSNRVVLYNQNEGVYDNLLSCKSGVSNIDNTCVCPGSLNSSPFNGERTAMQRLFVPENGSTFPDPSPGMRCVMAERRPVHLSQPYEPYLGSCNK